MKIALLVSDRDAWESFYSGLKTMGHDVIVFEVTSITNIEGCLRLSDIFSDGDAFDIIHNDLGPYPLIFSRFISTPVLTTIDRIPTDADIDLYRSFPGPYVASSGDLRIEGVNFIAVIDQKREDIAESYLDIYDRILKANAREDHRPWGFYEVLSDNKDDHKVKRITVWPKKRLSLQLHHRRKEHWVIVSGKAKVTLGKNTINLGPSQSVDIPLGSAHRIENTGDEPLVFIEVQQGDYFGEDDIVRLDDDFGRT